MRSLDALFPPHVVLLRDLVMKAKLIAYARDGSLGIHSLPRGSGEAWETLKSRGLIMSICYEAPSEDSPCAEYEAMVITETGRALLWSYGLGAWV
jgi:hypothetical protein